MYKVARASDGTLHNTLALARRRKISFILYTEGELHVWPGQDFRICGADLNRDGCTDDDGFYEYEPVGFGEYELRVGNAAFRLPTLPPDAPPHPVHVPYDMLPDVCDAWTEPTPEELQPDEP